MSVYTHVDSNGNVAVGNTLGDLVTQIAKTETRGIRVDAFGALIVGTVSEDLLCCEHEQVGLPTTYVVGNGTYKSLAAAYAAVGPFTILKSGLGHVAQLDNGEILYYSRG